MCSVCVLGVVQPSTQDMIGLGEEYPCRSYGPSWKLFSDITLDKRGNVQSEQHANLALYQRSSHSERGRAHSQERLSVR